MVPLARIYTRSGDSGQTSLGDGSRVDKTCGRVVAMGTVDELNSQLGVAICCVESNSLRQVLSRLQQQLFDLGADLCCPVPAADTEDRCPRIASDHVGWLEQQIDAVTEELSPVDSFVLPGGTKLAAALHMARAVCRRAETACLVLQHEEPERVNSMVSVFLNRLSDLLFALGRQANRNGADDVLWTPGSAADES